MSRKFAEPRIKPVIGPPQALVSRIDHLQTLLQHLPAALPDNPAHSLYSFAADPELLKEGGYFAAVGHALEISFGTNLLAVQGRTLVFTERGHRHDVLIKLLKLAVKHMSPSERTSFQEAWIDRLIQAALDSGAKIPAKKRKAPTGDTGNIEPTPPPAKKSRAEVITVQDSDDDEPEIVGGTNTNVSPPSSTPPIASSSSASLTLPVAPSHSSSARSTVLGNPQQSTLKGFGWKKGTPADTHMYWAKVKEAGSERREIVLQPKEKTAEEKQQRERDLARLRQQRSRARRKAEKEDGAGEVAKKSNANTLLLQGADALAHGSKAIPDVAALSRPDTQAWRKNRTGTLGGAVRGKPKKVFWFTPFLWGLIEPAVRRCGWSAARTVKELQRAHPNIFYGLHRATLWKWMHQQPKIIGWNWTHRLRVSGCVVNVQIARSLMIAIISKHKPELLTSFSCSEKYVRGFLDSTLNWSSRKATRAAKHIPENASELCERTFFRLAHTIEHQNIPAKLIINYDQTGKKRGEPKKTEPEATPALAPAATIAATPRKRCRTRSQNHDTEQDTAVPDGVDEVSQSVMDNVTQILEQETFIAVDRNFLKRREKELAREINASGYRMQHFFHLHRYFVDKLDDLKTSATAQEMDQFLKDD
ncbi:hypothetical protein C8R46DRAFT_1215743 [Mycena filopes]|nr:hypothetical protein C8R46DRAFT_1215743 [Mycena filopes]